RTWTITDLCGNTSTCDQTINVNDSTVPVISACPVTRNIEGCTTADITGPAFSPVTAASSEAEFENATNQGSASDGCGIATVTYIDVAAGSCPIVVTRTWTITDACGNTTTCNQTINVDDTTAPLFLSAPPADVTVQCPADVAASGNLTWIDNCGSGIVAAVEVSDGNTCPEIITRTWTYTDACGNSVSAMQTITVLDDTPPVFSSTPADITISCASDLTPLDLTWTDNCDGTGTVASSDVSDGMTCPETITRTWSYTDACGNNVTHVQTVTINDVDAPVFTNPPGDITVQCQADIPLIGDLTWTDNCDGSGTVSASDVSDGMTCPETVTRTWTYTDACGNVATHVQIITVLDDVPPVFDAPPADVTFVCFDDVPPMMNLQVNDNCDGSLLVPGTETSDGGSCPEIITRTWTYSDQCGNSVTHQQMITVSDVTPPVINGVPADITVQ
ncbi:MAG: hypothetical protein R3330_14770, partial [Saprospiraceae bacterium]|nr:hypothetical protein [Saprospiraceae bacterium]